MKHVKHCLFAAITALLLMVAFGGSAFAAEHTITINPGNQPTGHTYKAYQIFKGTLETGGQMSNVEWSNQAFGSALIEALKAESGFGEGENNKFHSVNSAGQVADVIDDFGADSADAKLFAKVVKSVVTPGTTYSSIATTFNFANNVYTATVDEGYYLIVDNGNNSTPTGDYNSEAILNVTNDVEISPKGNVPTVEKKVKENTKVSGEGWNDVADYNIGDAVPFRLTGTLPSNFDEYSTYAYTFNDTASAGLTLPTDTSGYKVYVDVDGSGPTKREQITAGYTITVNNDTHTFSVSFTDLKSVTYTNSSTNKLTKDSTIIVEYNAILNSSAVIGLNGNPNTVKLIYSNNPGGTGTGTTPEDSVVVFTYKLDVTKVNRDNTSQKVGGAKFKLKNANNQYATVVEGKVTDWTEESGATVLESDTNGTFSIAGLDDGTYTLIETESASEYVTPTGTDAETKFTISATTSNGDAYTGDPSKALTAIELTNISGKNSPQAGTKDVGTGTVGLTIKNARQGSLPSTGSMGMFIMIGVGICLMAGAGVYLLKNRKKA